MSSVWGKVKQIEFRTRVLSPLRTNLCEYFFVYLFKKFYTGTLVICQTVWPPWFNLEIYSRNCIASGFKYSTDKCFLEEKCGPCASCISYDIQIIWTIQCLKKDYTGNTEGNNIVFMFTVFPEIKISWIEALTELMPRDSAQNNFRNKLLQVLNRILEKQHKSYEPKWRIRRFK